MKKAIEKVDSRIILISKKNNINYNIDKSDRKIVYTFDDYKLGYIRIDINLDEKFNLSDVIFYGINDELLKIVATIENKRKLFGLNIQRLELRRLDHINTELKVIYDKSEIEEFEELNKESESIYSQNIFTDKKKEYYKRTKKAYYDSTRIYTDDPIEINSTKFLRPENFFIGKEANTTPDENGNVNCYYCINCKNCINCIGCVDCTDCTECTNCNNSTDCTHSYGLIMCVKCDDCIDCLHCKTLFACEGLIGTGHIGATNAYLDGKHSHQLSDYKFFPKMGSFFYHEKIESFFLINHFIPYHRPYDFASNYNWSIQWHISMYNKKYWITEKPSNKYENRIYSISELAPFFMMNKLKYQMWELETYFCEYFNLSGVYLAHDSRKIIDRLITPNQHGNLSIYDEIKTKKPEDCLYNHLYGHI